ncbi:MAG: hypothetical protein AAGF07_00190 [Patescibacteria group bacterium]
MEILENGDSKKFLEVSKRMLDLTNQFDISFFEAINKGLTDSDSLNRWIFSLDPSYNNLVIWFAPVMLNNSIKYVWMVGKFDREVLTVRKMIDNAYPKFKYSSLLSCPVLPPYLGYVSTIATSTWQETLDTTGSGEDFAIFQVSYNGADDRKDIDQLMVLNSKYLVSSILDTETALTKVCDESTLDYIKTSVFPRLNLLTKLHTELHNIAHFCGDWIFDETKDIHEYEAIEEYRACLGAIFLSKYTSLDKDTRIAFAVLVVITRIFKYGLEGINNTEKTRQVIREITVAIFFLEDLLLSKSIEITLQGKGEVRFSINLELLLDSIDQSLNKICKYESENKAIGKSALVRFAVNEYSRVYPNKQLSEKAYSLYKKIS